MYNLNRLEWHLDERRELINPAGYCVVLQNSKHSFDSRHSFAVALAKSQDHRASCGVFAFGLPNAVRRWLGKRYPVTRASQSRGRGLSPRARWLKQSGTVRCDGMAPKSNTSRHRQTLVLTTVRLCFAPTFTKEQQGRENET